MCFCSVNNITFSSLAARAASLEAVGHANNRGLKKVVGGAGGWPRRNPPRRALNVAPNGRNFIPTDCSVVSPSLTAPNRNLRWRWKIVPSPFQFLFFHPFSPLLSPLFHAAGQWTDGVFFYVITRKSPQRERPSLSSRRRCPMSTRSLSQCAINGPAAC